MASTLVSKTSYLGSNPSRPATLFEEEIVMFVCPTCDKQFDKEENLVKHFLQCWKEKNPNHQSKAAPRSEDIDTREENQDILDFFNSFK